MKDILYTPLSEGVGMPHLSFMHGESIYNLFIALCDNEALLFESFLLFHAKDPIFFYRRFLSNSLSVS
jgi:hypothetical protein